MKSGFLKKEEENKNKKRRFGEVWCVVWCGMELVGNPRFALCMVRCECLVGVGDGGVNVPCMINDAVCPKNAWISAAEMLA